MAGAGFHTAVDHHQVAVVDPVLAHAIAAGPHVEGADRVRNQGGLEIQGLTQRARAEGHRLANGQVGQDQTSKGGSTAVLLLVGWVGSAVGLWPGHKRHIPHLVPGFAFGISQPVEGAAVGSVLGDDQDRCTRPADPPKLLTTCQHNQIAGGRVLEIWGHRCTVETSGDWLPSRSPLRRERNKDNRRWIGRWMVRQVAQFSCRLWLSFRFRLTASGLWRSCLAVEQICRHC